MAIFTNVDTNAPVASYLSRAASAVGDFFVAIADAHSRRAEFEALNDMTDAELAAMGLARHEIAQHVFRDKLYV